MIDATNVRAIEAIILVAQEPVPSDLLAQLLEMPLVEVEAVCVQLARTYEEAGHGFQLSKVAGGWRFQTHPDLSAWVERFLLEGQKARLSGAALETLAIIAYKQPISRMQIAAIRGVDPDAVLRTLQSRAYIMPIGRDTGPGQAVLWGTTTLFLEKLGLVSLDDLPPLASFVPDPEIVETLERTLRFGDVETDEASDEINAAHDDGARAMTEPDGAAGAEHPGSLDDL